MKQSYLEVWRCCVRQIVFVLLCGLVLSLSGASLAKSQAVVVDDRSSLEIGRSDTTPTPVSEHYVVFLNGINSFATSEKPLNGDFDAIQKRLLDDLKIHRFVYFSYSAARHKQESGAYCRGWGSGGGLVTGGCQTYIGSDPVYYDNLAELSAWPEYEKGDTHRSIDLQVAALDWLLRQITARDGDAKIHLVGFSLGGVVASRWAAHEGRAANWKHNVKSIVLVESPVGGIPLAGPFSRGCGIDPVCGTWKFILNSYFGETILQQLQMPEDSSQSIIGSLPDAARTYPLTSIQSTADYLVNDVGLPLCDFACVRSDSVPIGRGTQYWAVAPHTLYFDDALGGNGLASQPLKRAPAISLLEKNHGDPLSQDMTVGWVVEAIEREATLEPIIIEPPTFPLLEPEAEAEIFVTLQNVSNITWQAGDYSLVNIGNSNLSPKSELALDINVPSGSTVQWPIPIKAPALPGIYRTEWQFSYKGILRGSVVWADIVVVPYGSSDQFVGVIQGLIDQAMAVARERFEEEWAKIRQQIIDMIEAELERIFIETLKQICGGPGTLLPLAWGVIVFRRRARKRGMNNDDR